MITGFLLNNLTEIHLICFYLYIYKIKHTKLENTFKTEHETDYIDLLWYDWNIVESGVKHHNPPPLYLLLYSPWFIFVIVWVFVLVEANLCRLFNICLYRYCVFGEGWDPINWFNPTTFVCLSQNQDLDFQRHMS